jgi:hypothetical protein
MLANTILWRNNEKYPPTFKDVRRILKMLIEARKQMESLGSRAGV